MNRRHKAAEDHFVKKIVFLVLAGAAIIASFAAVTYGLSPRPGYGLETIAAIALPALVSALVLVAYMAERRRLRATIGTVNELNAQLIRKEIELEHLSTVDELTGLATRRSFEEMVRVESERVRRHRRSLAVLLIEIDDLHTLGERFGKLGRGFLISQVSEILRETLRINDAAGRYGSETFALLLPETAEAQARAVAEKLRGRVEVNSFMAQPYETPVRLTLSQGIAVQPSPGIDTPEALLRAAEEALRDAKLSGFDSLCVYTPPAAQEDGPPVRAMPKAS